MNTRTPKAKPALSKREKDVLNGIAAGKSFPQIAHDLGLGFETVKTYATRLRSKIGVQSKQELATWAATQQ